MDNTDADLLSWAIDDMVEYYRGEEATLARKILWFSFFFRRGSRLPLQERQKVEERLKMFEQLLEQDEWVLKQKALSEQKGEQIGFTKGRQTGFAEGEVHALQNVLLTIIKKRFPSLSGWAQQKVSSMQELDALERAIDEMLVASDEATACFILGTKQ